MLPHNKFELIHESTLEKCIKHWNEIEISASDPWCTSELEKDGEATSQNDLPSNSHSHRYNLRDRNT